MFSATCSRQRQWLIQGALVISSLFVVAPLLWLLRLAFDGTLDLQAGAAPLLPSLWSFANVVHIWSSPVPGLALPRLLANSLIVATSTALVAMLAGTTAAYTFARYSFPGRKVALWSFLVLLTLPPAGLLAPFLVYFDALHIRDSLLALIMVYSAVSVPLAIVIVRAAIQRVPVELEEAALLEGASGAYAFRHSTLPLIAPAVVTAGCVAFAIGWSEFAVGWVCITSPERATLAMALARLGTTYDVPWGLPAALALFVALPVVVLFYLLRRSVTAAWTLVVLPRVE